MLQCMTPQALLSHFDTAQLWPDLTDFDVPTAYQRALAVRELRLARGEQAKGYKIGFTNRNIWARYNVSGPVWGTVYDSTLIHCDGHARVPLAGMSQPRLEPEAVFCLRASPPADPTLAQLFDCIDWVAPGFELVQAHQANWRFAAPDAIADGALHAKLVVGKPRLVSDIAQSASDFCGQLAAATVRLNHAGTTLETGHGSAVLDDPLQALLHFARELRNCPGAPDLRAGDVITTGTWTDAWPVLAGQTWSANFDSPLSDLGISFE